MITTEAIASFVGNINAWPISVNIMAEFRKSGAYPLNPGVIDDRQLAPSFAVNYHSKEPDPKMNESSQSPGGSISSEQERLFQKRYEEGYDLPDPVYQNWLARNNSRSDRDRSVHYTGLCEW